VLASFTYRRVREFPISGGPSTCRISEHIADAEVLGGKILSAMKWDSLAMVEFRRDARTKSLHLMEINPRIWGSIALAITAGIDFPALALDAAMGYEIKQPMWNEGVMCHWMFGEILHFLKKGRPFSAFREAFLTFLGKNSDDIFDWNDFAPFLVSVISILLAPFSMKSFNDVFRRGI
ncbi:MAG: ATP-grasp domain-containing protein, partial [Planctomycetota bacterium]|nr:ATP-grasp domain-containing protein [Planctomycetota bacterium]